MIHLPDSLMTWRRELSEARAAYVTSMFGDEYDEYDPAEGVIDGDTVRLFGPIEPWLGIDAYAIAPKIAAMETDEITVAINSPGGYIFDAVLLYNTFVSHSANVVVEVHGVAASAASFIAMAGDEIVMLAGSEMMLHQARGGGSGTAAEMREMADFLDRQTDKVAGIYAKRTGRTKATFLKVMDSDTWYSPSEAVSMGLADRAVAPKGKPKKAQNKIELLMPALPGRIEEDAEAAPDGAQAEVAEAENTPAMSADDDDSSALDDARLRAQAMAAVALAI